MQLPWYFYPLGFAIGLGSGLAFSMFVPANAADQSYCALYAREATRIDIMHTTDIDKITADTDYILMLAQEVYKQCVSVLPTPLPLPPEHRNMNSWLADMRDLLVSQAGTEPAGENYNDKTWREQCRAEYSTWNEDTGTVVRRGSSERVKCPCGGEVVCVQ